MAQIAEGVKNFFSIFWGIFWPVSAALPDLWWFPIGWSIKYSEYYICSVSFFQQNQTDTGEIFSGRFCPGILFYRDGILPSSDPSRKIASGAGRQDAPRGGEDNPEEKGPGAGWPGRMAPRSGSPEGRPPPVPLPPVRLAGGTFHRSPQQISPRGRGPPLPQSGTLVGRRVPGVRMGLTMSLQGTVQDSGRSWGFPGVPSQSGSSSGRGPCPPPGESGVPAPGQMARCLRGRLPRALFGHTDFGPFLKIP